MGQISLHTCHQIRELCSASLDGELSELDEARVQAHLATCAGCSVFAATAANASSFVRATPLEHLDIPIVLPGRRLAIARKLQVVAAAAAVTLAVGLSAAVGTLSTSSSSSSARHSSNARQSANLRFPDQELKMLERASQARSHPRLAL